MKKYILMFVMAVCSLSARAQDVCFWTNDAESLPIRVYVDKSYVGDVTAAYDRFPGMGAEGCLTFLIAPSECQITAVNRYGEVYDGWPGTLRPRHDADNVIKIARGQFVQTERSYDPDDDLFWLWVGWDPVYRPVPYVHHHHAGWVDKIDTDDDYLLLLTMSVAAVGGLAAMTAIAARNWSFPDSRFPYISAGYEFQYLPGLGEYRNVARLKYRMGNLGGLSLTGDIGHRTSGYSAYSLEQMDLRRSDSGLTWSAGLSLDYAGFNFGLRYKPALYAADDSFLVAALNYDFLIGRSLVINIDAGFGVSGYGSEGLVSRFEFPLGIGLGWRF